MQISTLFTPGHSTLQGYFPRISDPNHSCFRLLQVEFLPGHGVANGVSMWYFGNMYTQFVKPCPPIGELRTGQGAGRLIGERRPTVPDAQAKAFFRT